MHPQKSIAIIGPAWPLRGGGMSTFNERMARAFMQQGHKVKIYTFSLQYPSILFPGSSQYSEQPKPNDLDIEVVINSVNPLNWWQVGNKIKRAKHDIVVVRYWLPFMGPSLGTLLRRIKTNKHSKIICIADNVVPHEKRIGDTQFTKYFLQPVDAFITMSKKVTTDLLSFLPKTKYAEVVHPLYDNFGEEVNSTIAREKLGLQTEDFIILFFGFIRKYKGLDVLLEAMPKVLQKLPNAKLLIAGEFYEDEDKYRSLIETLSLKNAVVLHNHFIADDDVKQYFGAADVVVQPYKNATQSGVTPLAYHFELPMIVTNVGGLPEMVEDGLSGLVAEPNANEIAEKIIAYHNLGKAYFVPGVQRLKRKFSWEIFTEKIFGLAN